MNADRFKYKEITDVILKSFLKNPCLIRENPRQKKLLTFKPACSVRDS